MRYLSLFSGIEAATVAWRDLGWECVAVAEIDPFASAVLAQRFPDVPNLGDVTKITKAQIERLGEIDIVVGGFPCQDLSIVGKRRGLKLGDGTLTRSGLFYVALQIVKWAKPRFLLLENVPGLLSSNSGRDFAAVVEAILECRLDGEPGLPTSSRKKLRWENAGIAASRTALLEWATLDAQYFGVPQRRRRIFALADFGDWRDRPPILFVPESLHGDPETLAKPQHKAASGAGASLEGGGKSQPGVAPGTRNNNLTPPLSFYHHSGLNQTIQTDLSPPLIVSGKTSGIPPAVLYCLPTKDGVNRHLRRFTPTECERLQGFPDSHTKIAYRKKLPDQCPSGARYKALGNAFPVPVLRWIGKQIQKTSD